ncbi:ATP-binding protein [Streptomyces apocyni]|uniref:ATP-binding protein n=1 Tax=Streptomyces apocyni TaxID=2654677 RepID=UPI0012EAC637|nr:ATP-binding protein [Streptomyces apocyni]
MRSQLYARDPLLHALVPRLVGLAPAKRELVRQEHPGDQPVVLLTGRHGMGKTAVLAALDAAYRGRVPLGRVDVSEADPARHTGFAASNASTVVEVLVQLACDLAPTLGRPGRPVFPRLLPGLFAISSWHRGGDHERRLARDRIDRLLTACDLREDSGAGPEGGGVQDWTYEISEGLADAGGQQDLEAVATAVIARYFHQHTKARPGRTAREWYQGHVPGSADGEAALVRLCLRFHQGGAYRHAVERLLVAAFTEDVTGAYGRWQRANRTPRPLILLDNVHTEAGEELLDLILQQRAAAPDTHDPLVVIATRLGDTTTSRYPDATRRRLTEVLATSGWSRTAPASPSAGLLVIPLAPLDLDDVLLMLDRADAPLHRHLPAALHALTRGHPEGSALLGAAVVRTAGERTVRPEELLDLPAHDGRPVTELLLERLIPHPQHRDHLILLSPAPDRAAADALAARSTGIGGDPLPAAEAARYLEEEHWTAVPEGEAADDNTPDTPGGSPRFVPDPFLRDLLIHQARGGADAGRRWDGTHIVLREHYATLGPAHVADVLRHTLAGFGAEPVVARLTQDFGRQDVDAADWLRALRHISTAPHPPLAHWRDDRAEIARGAHDHRHPDTGRTDGPGGTGGPGDTGTIARSVNRLLHAVWYLREPFAEPLDDLCEGVGTELRFLSVRHPTGHAVLNRAAQTWPVALRHRWPRPIEP